MGLGASRPTPTDRRAIAGAWLAMALLFVTSSIGPSWGMDPWVIGAFGLVPFGLLGWALGRWRTWHFAFATVGMLSANLLGAAWANRPLHGVLVNALGAGLLVATAALAAMARRATDGHHDALLEAHSHAAALDDTLEMQRAIADTASALIQQAPSHAIDVAIAAIRKSVDAISVYLAMCGSDGENLPQQFDFYDGAEFRHQVDVTRPWATDPSMRRRLEEGGRLTYAHGDDGTTETVFPIVSSTAKVTGLVGIITSTERQLTTTEESMLTTIAELVGAAWDRQRNADRLEQLLRSKDRFIASVSHELRTPLAVIVGLAAELRDSADDFGPEETAALIGLISQQSEELGDMIEDLLVSARAEEHQLTVLPDDVDLSDLVPRILGSLPAEVSPKVTCCDTRPPIVRADPLRLRQIIRNLIVNAHRHGGPSIRLTVGVSGEKGLIRVTDDGPGIPPEFHETIFTAYGRATSMPGRTESIGLGLTVSRQLARLMGGDITYTHDAAGSTFELSLPLADHQPPDVGLPMGATCTPTVGARQSSRVTPVDSSPAA